MNRTAARRKGKDRRAPNRAQLRDREVIQRQVDPAVRAAFKRALAPDPPSQIAEALRRAQARRAGIQLIPTADEMAYLERKAQEEQGNGGLVLP